MNSYYTRAERRQIQSALNGLGYHVGVVDGSLGGNSRRGISQYQAARGEAATGQLTRDQFNALMSASVNPAAAYVVDRRLARNEVALMQQSLQRLGFYGMRIDGSYGRGTSAARTNFLYSQGRDPNTTTHVQAAVLAAQAAGLPVPAYLMQEAQSQFQQSQSVTYANTTGQPGQGGYQPQQTYQQQPFPQPGPTNQFQAPTTVAAQQQNPLFGNAPQPGAAIPQAQQNTLFQPPSQQQPGVAVGQPAPATNPLFAPAPTAPAVPVPTQQRPAAQSNLDVLVLQQPPQSAASQNAGTQAAVTPQPTAQQPVAVSARPPAQYQPSGTMAYAAPASGSAVPASQGNLDVFAPLGN